MKKIIKLFLFFTIFLNLLGGVNVFAQNTELEKKVRFEKLLQDKNPEEAINNDLRNAFRADNVEAIRWYQKAAVQDNEGAKKALKRLGVSN